MKKSVSTLLKWILGIIIILLLFYKVGFTEVLNSILKVNIKLYLVAIVFSLLSLYIGAINIKILMNFVKKIKLNSLLMPYLYSWSVGLFGPSKLGDFSLPLFLKKQSINLGLGTAVVLVDKIISFAYLAILSIIALSLFNIKEMSLLVIILISILIILALSISSLRIRQIIRKYILRNYQSKFTGFSKLIFNYIKNGKRFLIANVLVTILVLLSRWLGSYFLFLSLGEKIPIIYIILVSSIVWISGLIPITISGLGVKQSVAIYLYGFLGISSVIVLANQTLAVATNYILASVFLIHYLVSKRSSQSIFN